MSHLRMYEIEKSIQTLQGIVQGITLDYELSAEEIGGLVSWLEQNEHLQRVRPFKDICLLLQRILEDHVIDEDEYDELMGWCLEFTEASGAKDGITAANRRLLGVLHGLTVDGYLSNQEILDLRDWLEDYGAYRDLWPFCDIWALVEDALADGKVTEEERANIQKFCDSLKLQHVEEPKTHDKVDEAGKWTTPEAPVYETLEALCDATPSIEFSGMCSCFTGQAKLGKREKLNRLVQSRGGSVSRSVSRKTNYLILGYYTSPNWAYSAYGRKIETALELRRTGHQIFIVHENEFVQAIES